MGIGAYAWRHPRVQAPMDPDKKTVVVLGSGWASTSFIKKLDTRYYNLVYITRNINRESVYNIGE